MFFSAVGPYRDIDDFPTKRLLLDTKLAPYFEYCFGKRPVEELYDLLRDPDEVMNVAADPAYRAVKQPMAAEVDRFMKDSADPRELGPTSFWDQVPYTGPKLKHRPIH